jgi:PPOX class probable F420-dependent enzyme
MVGSIIYVESGPNSGKIKRIRHTPHVELAPCDFWGHVNGPTVEGQARILSNPGEVAAAKAALTRKYPLVRSGWYGLLDLLRRLRRKPLVALDYIAVALALTDS